VGKFAGLPTISVSFPMTAGGGRLPSLRCASFGQHRGEHQEGAGEGDRGILKIAAEFGVGSGTVQRIKAEMARAAD
jgi:hypothetical protein